MIETDKLKAYPFVLITSASEGEESYMLRDDPYSIFIGTVLEALALLSYKYGSVRLFDFIEYVTHHVPIKASKIGKMQNPTFLLQSVKENFVII